ncbi:hypothetical protein BsWGS_26591 [Bradybaena similaris]
MMFCNLILVAVVLTSFLVQCEMYRRHHRGREMHPHTQTIHVHHFDAGSSESHKKHHGQGGSSSLMELLLLSSLLGGRGGLGQNQPIGIPIPALPGANFLGR